MSASIEMQALDAVIAELNAAPPVGVPAATKRRYVPGEKVTAARMAVLLGDEVIDSPVQTSRLDKIRRARAQLAVQCIASVDSLPTIDEAPEAMKAHVISVLGMTNLGGLVHYVRETGTARRVDLGDLNIIVLTILFEMSFQTRRDDITVRN